MSNTGGQVDTRSVLFTDLVASTELRVELGEVQADALRRRHDDLLRETITDHGGTVVKGLGDGVMATFTAAADAVAAAVAIQQAVYKEQFDIRIGLSVGDVNSENDDVFGTPVVEASRLCAMATAGEILAAELVRALARGRGGFVFEPMGDLELKGLPEPVPATRVVWEPLVDSTGDGADAAAVPLPDALLSGISATYVGRPALLDSLDAHWQRTCDGSTRAVLLAGEPGVGKTRTAAELGRRIHGQGGLVLYGRCEEGLGAPYQPFVEALDWYSDHAPSDSRTFGRLPGELTRLLPDLANRVAGLPAPTASDPGSEEHRLFEATTSWLIDASKQAGLVLVLDDLHWATKPTLLLTLHLLRAASESPDARLLVLVTYRDTDIDRAHPLSGLLGDLRRLPAVERAPVDNLTREEVLALMESAAGHDMDEAGQLLADALYTETEGNPFFLTEVLRHLIETGAIRREGERFVPGVDVAALTIPEGVRDVVGRRLSRLSAEVNEVLSIGSVMGRELEVDTLVALSDAGEDIVLDALDEAVRARLVEETGVDRYRFAHALVRTTLYDELSATRRRRLHRRIADVIEKLRPHDYVALSYHCAEGGADGGDISRAVRYGLAAAEQSLTGRAFADAEHRFLGVLDMLEDHEDAEPLERVAALVGLGEAQRDQSNAEYRETLLDASRRALELGHTELLVRAVLGNSRGISSVVGNVDPERIELIEAALDVIGPALSAERARLLAQLASEVTFSGDNARRVAAADDAEAMARALGDPSVLGWVLVRIGYAMVVPSRWERQLESTAEAVRLADEAGDPSQRTLARLFHSAVLILAGRIDDAAAVTESMVDVSAEASPAVHWMARANAVRNDYPAGLPEVERINDEIFAFGQDAGQPDALMWWGATRAALAYIRGESAEVTDAVAMFADQFPLLRAWRVAVAWNLADAGRLDDANAVLDEWGLRGVTMEDEPLPLVCPLQLAGIAFALDDAELAAGLVDVLTRYSDNWAHFYLGVSGPTRVPLGMCKATLGDFDEAVELFAGALDELDGVGYEDIAARYRLYFATILGRRGAEGDVDRARGELAIARARAETMPAPRLIDRIDALLASMT